MMPPTNDGQIPVFLELPSTDWCVWDAPSWLNKRSPTRSHSLQYAHFMVSRSLDEPDEPVSQVFAPWKTSLVPTL